MDNTTENQTQKEATFSTSLEPFGYKKSTSYKAQIQENSLSQDMMIKEKQILLEDSTLEKLPNYVDNLLNIFIKQDHRNEADLLTALIYCIALESGFAVEDCVDENSKDNNIQQSFFYGSTFNKRFTEIYSHKFPAIFQDECNLNLYKFQLSLVNYANYKCNFIAIRTGEYLVVTLTNNNEPGYSWCLSIPRYVLSRRSKILPSLFRNLRELSMIMKENIFVPVRNFILADSNNLYPGLTGLPVELSHFILGNLNLKDLQNLSKTCWKFRCICVDYYESKHKTKTKPFGSKHTMLSDSSSAFFRNFF